MTFARLFACLLIFSAAASATEIKIRVLDPQSAAVSGAQVELFGSNNARPDVEATSAEGIAVFKNATSFPYRIRVLASGFARATTALPSPPVETVTVQLRLAPAAETVVVTATRTPVPVEASGAVVENLGIDQLKLMNPVAASDALRFLPGAVVDMAGQRGGLASLFVQGGNSNYNKVIVDGVTINEPGGTFNFGTLPLTEADSVEFMRGAQSTLYGSDAMTSVVQVSTRTGSTETPELRFGADGGNFSTANGYASLAGARNIFDYDVFADQFNTSGQGVNNEYSNSLQGGNIGVKLNDESSLRLHVRHANSFSGVSDEWNFNGGQIIPPDQFEYNRLNNLLASLTLTLNAPSGWQHQFTGFEYRYRTNNADPEPTDGRISPTFGNINFVYDDIAHINRAGFEYQGDYSERSWAHTTVGYRFEQENGNVGPVGATSAGHRQNDDVYAQQILTLGRLSVIAGARFVHNSAFGNTGVPRIALTFLAARGGNVFSGTRLRFTYATGFKEPRLEETFAGPPFSVPNINLQPEKNRSFEAGFQQDLFASRFAFSANYFNNLFHNLIDGATDPTTFITQYINIDKSFAQGAVVELNGKIWSNLTLSTAYTYTSTQILQAPLCTPANFCDPLLATGQALLRRPKNSATALFTYIRPRWGANLDASFVGRRPDSDFFGFGIDHSPGYVRLDTGGWYALNSRVTTYANIENVTNKFYEEVTGYPALGVNFRAGMRFRIGGE
ncbi:MAG: TonB-dependent receptor domain-containing protein [Terriglobales bacterium]|jgi:outer membrane cobalamin receptor|nr:TonB-dependent receptor [Terriglobales bacterium]